MKPTLDLRHPERDQLIREMIADVTIHRGVPRIRAVRRRLSARIKSVDGHDVAARSLAG